MVKIIVYINHQKERLSDSLGLYKLPKFTGKIKEKNYKTIIKAIIF